jgi:hypothetical protein
LRKPKAYLIKKRIVRKISHEKVKKILLSEGLSYRKSKKELEQKIQNMRLN